MTRSIFATFILSLCLMMSTSTAAQTSTYTANQEGWLVSVDEAFAKSKKLNKPILANFTGSDWCGWCKRLSASVFTQDEFKKWAAKNVILLELDFPRRKALPKDIESQNYSMQQAFRVQGYPTVWLFDLDKDKNNQYSIRALGKTGYTPTAKEFIDGLNQMMTKRTKV